MSQPSAEALLVARRPGAGVAEELERHDPAEIKVGRAIDHPHSAAAERSDDAEVGNLAANQRIVFDAGDFLSGAVRHRRQPRRLSRDERQLGAAGRAAGVEFRVALAARRADSARRAVKPKK